MKKSINEQVQIYKDSLNNNSLAWTYKFLMDYMNQLQRELKTRVGDRFTVKNILNGYLDYTYFYFENDFLKERKLKLALVLNHQKMCFEIWLLGNTKKVQEAYWEKFKKSSWTKEETMPQWYIVSFEVVSSPNFEEKDKITDLIIEELPIIYGKWEKLL